MTTTRAFVKHESRAWHPYSRLLVSACLLYLIKWPNNCSIRMVKRACCPSDVIWLLVRQRVFTSHPHRRLATFFMTDRHTKRRASEMRRLHPPRRLFVFSTSLTLYHKTIRTLLRSTPWATIQARPTPAVALSWDYKLRASPSRLWRLA